MAAAFRARGYQDSELYATTYGTNAGAIPIQPAMLCNYMKGVS